METRLCLQAQLESEVTLQLTMIKRQQQEIEKKKEDLLKQQNGLRQEMVRPELLLGFFHFRQFVACMKKYNRKGS